MAREIRYLEPVGSISGSLSQKQRLAYAKKNNSAWNAPRDERNLARNYKTNYVGLMRRQSGKNYFAVRRKSTFHSTATMIKNCALMGAANSIASAILKDLMVLAQVNILYGYYIEDGGQYGRRQFVVDQVLPKIKQHASQITITYRGVTVNCGNNPFTAATSAIAIPTNILVKFWTELTDGGIYFYVDGVQGIWVGNTAINLLVSKSRLNVLGLTNEHISTSEGDIIVMKRGGMYMYNKRGSGVYGNDLVTANEEFWLSADSPE